MFLFLFALCCQKGFFTVNVSIGFTQFILSVTSDGTSKSLDTMEKADDDDEENCSYSCQSNHNNHFSKLLFISMICVTSLNSLVSHKV